MWSGDKINVGNLVSEAYDYVNISYTGSNATTIEYRSGGPTGLVVATLTLTYDGSNNVTSITKN